VINLRVVKELFGAGKSILAVSATACLLALFFSQCFVYASPSTITVGSGESIQSAIDVASPGDTILVSAGFYNESLVVNKPVLLIGAGMDTTIIDGQNGQYVINVVANTNNVVIEGFTIQSALNPTYGIEITSDGSTISDDRVQECQTGIYLSFSTSNTVTDNIIAGNTIGGLIVYTSSNNTFLRNLVEKNYQGLNVIGSSNNDFAGNTFQGNANANPNVAESIAISYGNSFTDNNFLDSLVDISGGNLWNNTVEGNFWFNYNGSNSGDGTGKLPYYNNQTAGVTNYVIDYRPLLGQFINYEATFGTNTYEAYVISNSTISNLRFQVGTETGNRIISFNAAGSEGTYGFARLAIPVALMGTPFTVLIGGQQINPTFLSTKNTSSNYLYLTYVHSNQTILVISSLALNMYNQLLQQFIELNSTYYQLAANYTTQFGIISNDTAQFNTLGSYALQLNSTYNQLLGSYANLLGNYSQLQQKYEDLNSSYQQHLTDYNQNLQNVRSLMYIFAAATAVLIIGTIYFSRRTYPRSAESRSTQEPMLT